MERLRKSGSELVYRCAKQHSEPGSKPHGKRGPKVEEITLTPLQLIDRIAALVQAEPARTAAGEGARGGVDPLPTQAEPLQPVPSNRSAHYLWAVLIARIYEVLPLLCPICGGRMRILQRRHPAILEHIAVETEPPRITPARGPLLRDGADAQIDEGVEGADVEPNWDEASQSAPDFELDQRVSW